MAKRTNADLQVELPRLLEDRQMSLLALSRAAGLSDAHLHRIINGQKRSTGRVAREVARALGLAEDFFPEARAAFVCAAVERDPEVRDRLYDQLTRRPRRRR